MICVSVREKRCCVIRIYILLMVEMFYSFERCFTLFGLPLYSFTSVGVNRSGIEQQYGNRAAVDSCMGIEQQYGNRAAVWE